MTSLAPSLAPSLGQRRLEQHEARFGARQLSFAAHAALPVVLDPGFVHLLRINFFSESDALPWLAEVNLLFSPLCSDLGGGTYEIEPGTRSLLLERLATEGGNERMREVASLLWQYVHCRPAPWANEPGLERAQQLTALQFLDPGQCEQWLAQAEASPGHREGADRSWFLAVRRKLEPTQPVVARTQLVERLRRTLRDLETIYVKDGESPSRATRRRLALEGLVNKVRRYQGMSDEELALARVDVEILGEVGVTLRFDLYYEVLQTLGFDAQSKAARELGWTGEIESGAQPRARQLVIHGPPQHGHRWLAARIFEGIEQDRYQTIVLALEPPAPSRSEGVALPALLPFTSQDLERWLQKAGPILGLEGLPEGWLRGTHGAPDAVFEALCRELDLDLDAVNRHLRRFDEFIVDERSGATKARAADLLVVFLNGPFLEAIASEGSGWVAEADASGLGALRRRRTELGTELLAVAAPEASGAIAGWTTSLVATFQPRAVMVVGEAEGIAADVKFGNVVIAEETLLVRSDENGRRSKFGTPCDATLISSIRAVLSEGSSDFPTAHFGPVEYDSSTDALALSEAKANVIQGGSAELLVAAALLDVRLAVVELITGIGNSATRYVVPLPKSFRYIQPFLNTLFERLEPDLTVRARGTPAQVLVVGSAYGLSPIEVECAKALGKRLAEAGHSVIVGGMRGVDYLVASAFADVLAAQGIDLGTRLQQVVLAPSTPDFAGGAVLEVPTNDDWFATGVTQADAVALIGGEQGTELVYLLARDADVPVFPIATSGRFAAVAHARLERFPGPGSMNCDGLDVAALTSEQRVRRELRAQLGQVGSTEAAELISTHLLMMRKLEVNVGRRLYDTKPIWLASSCLAPRPIQQVNVLLGELWRLMISRDEPRGSGNRWRTTSPFPADRLLGYMAIQVDPRPSDLTMLIEALRVERALASEARETRPLFRLLATIHRIIDGPELDDRLDDGSTELRPALEVTADLLRARADLDPGGECKSLLARLLESIFLFTPRSLRHVPSGATIALKRETTVGSSETSTLRFPARYVSKNHAVIAWQNGAFYVRDLNSRNGTWVNGAVLPPHGFQRLDVGDRIRFGKEECVLVDDATPSESDEPR